MPHASCHASSMAGWLLRWLLPVSGEDGATCWQGTRGRCVPSPTLMRGEPDQPAERTRQQQSGELERWSKRPNE